MSVASFENGNDDVKQSSYPGVVAIRPASMMFWLVATLGGMVLVLEVLCGLSIAGALMDATNDNFIRTHFIETAMASVAVVVATVSVYFTILTSLEGR